MANTTLKEKMAANNAKLSAKWHAYAEKHPTAKKIADFISTHQTLMQAIKFTLISLVAFVSEFAIMYILQYSLLSTCGQDNFDWWIFHYAGGKTGAFGLAGFIAMLGSKTVAEIISFTQNWKKNFKANSNKVFGVTVYILTVIAIILFTQWFSGALAEVIHSEAALTVCKMVGSVVSFVVMFLMDKFVIMRVKKDKTPKEETPADETPATDATEEIAEETMAEEIAEDAPALDEAAADQE
jgi:putative flippase GtrA